MSNKPLDLIPLTSLKGVGPSLEKKFIRLGIHNLQDLLFHLPVRYEDRTKLNTISSVKLGDHAQICGEIVSSNILYGRRRSLQCLLQDSTGLIFIRFFHFNATQKESLIPGKKIFCYGEVRRGSKGFEIYHPEYKEIQSLDSILMESKTMGRTEQFAEVQFEKPQIAGSITFAKIQSLSNNKLIV